MKPKSAVILTIHRAGEMTPTARKRIAQWLDRQKKFFLKYPNKLSKRFTARYLFEEI